MHRCSQAALSLQAREISRLHIALPGPACELALGLQLRELGRIVGICAIPCVSQLSLNSSDSTWVYACHPAARV